MGVDQTAKDILFEIRNSFLLGNYQHCINESQKAKFSNPYQQLEKDLFMYKAYIAQRKYGFVVNEISAQSTPPLIGARMLALYLSGDSDKKAEIVSSIDKQVKGVNMEDSLAQHMLLLMGTIYYLEEDYDAVLRLFYNTDFIAGSALVIQTYLKINRIDLAQKELIKMKEADEDSMVTQLCQAWVNLNKGADKIQDAFYTFQEMTDKYSSTPMLLNGQAAALIALGKYDEAEPLLQVALDKDPNCPETLINMTTLSQHLGKPVEVSCRYLNQMKDSHSDHPFIKEYTSKEQEFDRLVRQYAPSVTD